MRVSQRTLVVIFALLAFALRLYRLDHQPLHGDESFTIQFSAHGPDWLLPNIANVEPNPPLYYLLLHYWMKVLGQSEFAARYLSLLFGVVSVPIILQLGRAMNRPKIGALAALLLAINPFQVWHAQDVRNYTFWPALSMTGMCFLLAALREGKARYWVGYSAMTLLSLYAHYYDLFLLLFQNLFVLGFIVWRWRQEGAFSAALRRTAYTWMAIQALLTLAFGPWLSYGSSRLVAITEGDSPHLWEVFFRCITTFSIGETVPSLFVLASLPVLLILLAYAFTHAFKTDRYHALFLILYIVVPSICLFAVAQVRPLFRERYLNVIAPAYYVTFAWGLISARETLRRWKAVPLVAGIAFFCSTAAYSLNNHYFVSEYQKSPDWRALSSYLEIETGPGDVIVLNYPDPTFSYYYHGRAPSLILPQGFLSLEMKQETAQSMRQLADTYKRIWFYPLTDVRWDNEGFVENWLNRHAALIDARDIHGFRWLVYTPTIVSLEEVQYLVDAGVGDAILLRGYDCDQCESADSGPLSVKPGITLHLTLYWEATDYVQTPYSVYIHLVNASGRVIAQRDSAPRGGDFPTQEWMPGDIIVDPHSITIPSDTQPGEYTMITGMYDPATGERLPVTDGEGSYLRDHVTVARLTVE
ncbi:MAG TPA: glycosyltransferase family 39 protein [Anaerolineae bacterium]|nr:glycosyltransferase family 39 protein [Anaerolineae bacterium]